MEFTLVYRGPLKANGNLAAKQAIRRAVHRQMQQLWKQQPLKDYHAYLVDVPPENEVTLIQKLSGFRFAPLVSPKLALIAELSITFLRPEAPGALITQGGDIDNRVKTLLDALRMPRVPGEIPTGEVPGPDEDPFFCLLEDDNLVTKLTVATDRLLEPVSSPSEVQLVLHVQTKRTAGTWGNIGLG